MNQNIKTFTKELRDLLNKHNVHIGVMITGDTYGIESEHFTVYDKKSHEKYIIGENSCFIDASDLKDLS